LKLSGVEAFGLNVRASSPLRPPRRRCLSRDRLGSAPAEDVVRADEFFILADGDGADALWSNRLVA